MAKDKHTKVHMCHVFRCDSAPAKEIANALRDTCRRIIAEKKSQSNKSINQTNSSPKRPNFLPDISNKRELNMKFKSLSCNNNELNTSAKQNQASPNDSCNLIKNFAQAHNLETKKSYLPFNFF